MNIPISQQSMRLSRGEAMTLRAQRPGVLRVTQGRIWATLGQAQAGGTSRRRPCSAAEPRGGDHFVTPQHDLCVAAGQDVVLESWPAADGSSALLEWIPA
jgi:hypothetical protein